MQALFYFTFYSSLVGCTLFTNKDIIIIIETGFDCRPNKLKRGDVIIGRWVKQ